MFSLNKKGFTIIELMIVVAIIVILALVLAPKLTGYIKRAQLSNEVQTFTNVNKGVVNAFATSFSGTTVAWDLENGTINLAAVATVPATPTDTMKANGEDVAIVNLSAAAVTADLQALTLTASPNAKAIALFRANGTNGAEVSVFKQLADQTICDAEAFTTAKSNSITYVLKGSGKCGLLSQAVSLSGK